MKWNNDMIYILTELVDRGVSHSRAALIINKLFGTRLTKNAITGKVWRLRREK